MTFLSKSSAVVNPTLGETALVRVGDFGEVSRAAVVAAGLGGDIGLVRTGGDVAAFMTGDTTGLRHVY
jgi:hypothetical protein